MATMPLGTGAELSTGQRAACQYHNLLQKTTSMGSIGSRTKDRRYDAGADRFISEDFIKGHIAVPYTMNHYGYSFNRPMDLVDLNGMWPTAVVTSDLAEMENIGNTAKAASKFEVPYVDVIIDVGVGIYDNCQSGASAREFISDAVVDVVLTTGEAVATSAITAGLSTIVISGIAGFTGGSVVPGIGNVVGLVIGIFLGIVITTLDSSDFDRNGKSLRDDIKDFVFGLVGGRLMQKTMSTASRGKLMWGIVLVMSMILGGLSVFCIIGNSQNPNSEFNKKGQGTNGKNFNDLFGISKWSHNYNCNCIFV